MVFVRVAGHIPLHPEMWNGGESAVTRRLSQVSTIRYNFGVLVRSIFLTKIMAAIFNIFNMEECCIDRAKDRNCCHAIDFAYMLQTEFCRVLYHSFKLAINYPTGHVPFGIRVESGLRGWGRGVIFTSPPLPLSLSLINDRPLSTNFSLSLAYRCH